MSDPSIGMHVDNGHWHIDFGNLHVDSGNRHMTRNPGTPYYVYRAVSWSPPGDVSFGAYSCIRPFENV